MRNFEERKAEVYLRSGEILRKKRRRRNALVSVGAPLILCGIISVAASVPYVYDSTRMNLKSAFDYRMLEEASAGLSEKSDAPNSLDCDEKNRGPGSPNSNPKLDEQQCTYGPKAALSHKQIDVLFSDVSENKCITEISTVRSIISTIEEIASDENKADISNDYFTSPEICVSVYNDSSKQSYLIKDDFLYDVAADKSFRIPESSMNSLKNLLDII